MFRRTRKPNYSHEETMVLLEQIEAHRHIMFGKATNHQRAELWTMVADAVNAVPNSAGRTIEELKHRWKDMSHRARISARSLSQAKANNEHTAVAPSVYFDIIMRILGEDISEGSEFGVLSFYEGQNSASRFTEEGEICPGKSEFDIKPDINAINRYLGADEKSHGLRINFGSTPPFSNVLAGTPTPTEHKWANVSSHTLDRAQNGGRQLSPGCGIKFSESSRMKHTSSNHIHNSTGFSPFNSDLPTSGQNGCAPISSWGSKTQHPVIRPMRLDPVTQEVTEVDGHNLDSDTSEDRSSGSRLVVSMAEERLENRENNYQETAEKSVTDLHHLPSSKKRKLDTENSSVQSLSVEDLKKLYLVKKIEMIGQRTHCFRLLEEKLKQEISQLKQKTLLGWSSLSHCTSPHCVRVMKRKGHELENTEVKDNEKVGENIIDDESKSELQQKTSLECLSSGCTGSYSSRGCGKIRKRKGIGLKNIAAYGHEEIGGNISNDESESQSQEQTLFQCPSSHRTSSTRTARGWGREAKRVYNSEDVAENITDNESENRSQEQTLLQCPSSHRTSSTRTARGWGREAKRVYNSEDVAENITDNESENRSQEQTLLQCPSSHRTSSTRTARGWEQESDVVYDHVEVGENLPGDELKQRPSKGGSCNGSRATSDIGNDNDSQCLFEDEGSHSCSGEGNDDRQISNDDSGDFIIDDLVEEKSVDTSQSLPG